MGAEAFRRVLKCMRGGIAMPGHWLGRVRMQGLRTRRSAPSYGPRQTHAPWAQAARGGGVNNCHVRIGAGARSLSSRVPMLLNINFERPQWVIYVQSMRPTNMLAVSR